VPHTHAGVKRGNVMLFAVVLCICCDIDVMPALRLLRADLEFAAQDPDFTRESNNAFGIIQRVIPG
jgi:hypothetical protein